MATRTVPLAVAGDIHELRWADDGEVAHGYTFVADEAVSRHGSYERRRLVVRDIADGSLWELPYEEALHEDVDLPPFPPGRVTLHPVDA
ncbi:hypothetical protein GCM10027294_25460 [Marinactinospora endophytica]